MVTRENKIRATKIWSKSIAIPSCGKSDGNRSRHRADENWRAFDR
jgi:hypothetical protein